MTVTPKQLIALMCEQYDMDKPLKLKLEIYTGEHGEGLTVIDIEDCGYDNRGVITFQPCDDLPLDATRGPT